MVTAMKKAILITLIILFVLASALGAFYFWWTNHAVFEYNLQPVVILENYIFFADDFIASDSFADGVRVARNSGSGPANLQLDTGRYEVPLTLELGLRSLNTTASLYILTPITQIYHEFAELGALDDPLFFIANSHIVQDVPFDLRFTIPPLPLNEYPAGEHLISLILNGISFSVPLIVEDTTPPTGTAIDVTIPMGEPVYPEDFVTDIFDASPISSISFINEPDVFLSGRQSVEVEVIDYFGNFTLFSSNLNVERNETPPIFEGIEETIFSTVGQAIIYRAGVTAFDAFGREIDFDVDSSQVDQHTAGIYTATFRAEDCCGNSTEVEIRVEVLSIDRDYVISRVDAILETILTDDMTQVEEARAIFNWIRFNMTYAAVRGGPASAYEGAFIALTERRGNCFIYYSIGEILLTRAGIPNMRVERLSPPGVTTTHHWSLINPDNLGWHHFDSNPVRGNLYFRSQMYMFTNSQAAYFASRLEALGSSRNYFTFDQSLFPEVVE